MEESDLDIREALQLASAHLELPIAIVSRILGEHFQIMHLVAPAEAPIKLREEFSLDQTYCAIALDTQEMVAIEHMGTSAYRDRACYSRFGLEAYLGVPLRVRGSLFGAVSFSSPQRRARPFNRAERGLVKLVASWVEQTLERQILRDEVRRLYEETPALLHCIGPDGKIVMVSNRWLQHFGYTREEVLGRRSTEFLTPECRARALEVELPRFFKEGRIEDVPYQFVRKNGEVFDVLLSGTVEWDQEGKVARCMGILRDQTELRRERARAEREQSLRARLFESAPDAIVVTDPADRLVELNPIAEALFGWKTSELQGRSIRELSADERDFADHEAAKSSQLRYRRRNESTFLGKTVLATSRDEGGALEGYIRIIRDVTEEVESRLALERANQRLELSVEALNQFAYIASHDLRTPLRGIHHLVSFIEEDMSAQVLEQIQPRLTQLRERVGRMDEMLGSLLRFARAGHEHEVLDGALLPDAVKAWVEDLKSGQPDAGLRVDLALEPLSHGTVNSVALEHVLSNLIGNSAAHHDRAEAQVWVRMRCVEGFAEFEVEDDGPGIPEQHHERVFQMFQTLDQGSSPSSTGMGLSLVRRLVLREGGELSLRSPVQKNRGCLFRFTVPISPRET